MNRSTLIRLAAIASICAAAAPRVCAQTPAVVAQPSSLTFDLRAGTPPSQNVLISLTNTTTPSTAATITASTGLRVNNARQITPVIPTTIFVSVDPFVTQGPSGQIQVFVPGLSTLIIPVCFIRTGGTQCPGGGTGTGNFFATPSQVTFTQTSTTPPGSAQVSLSATGGVIPTYFVSVFYTGGLSTNWLQVSPAPGTLSSSQFLTLTPNTIGLPAGTYTATVTLQPQNTGFNTVNIPVTLTVGTGGGTGNFYATPSALVFTTLSTIQSLTIYAATTTTFTITPSANLQGILSISPVFGTTPATVQVSVINPSAVAANTLGTLTVTPGSGSGYPAFQIPVQINSTGSVTGSLIVNPTSLLFTTTPGATAPQSQTINVTSSTSTQQVFSVSTSSQNGFLTAFASSTLTPAVITVGINPSAISQAGNYTGFVTITPASGIGAGVPVTVPVTVNVGTSAATPIIATPTSLTLEGRAGSTQKPSATVRLDVAAGLQAVIFTTAVKTTTGGNWLSVNTVGVAPGQLTITADPAALAAGTYEGAVTVTPTGSNPFDIRVTFTVTGSGELRVTPTSLSFAHQTTSQTNPPSQTVQITSTGTTLNWTATATSTGNWLQVSPASGTTGNALTVSVNPTGLTAGTYNGTISVSSSNATNPAQTINVTLTVTTPVVPVITSFVNGASFASSQVSPGLIATLIGTDLGPATAIAATPGASGFPTTLGEVQVLFDGRPAPLLYVSTRQVSTVAPFDLAGRVSTRVQVEYRGQRSRELELRVADATPGIFTLNQTGSGQGAVLNQNTSVNGPSNPEVRGNIVVIYATGLGSVFPTVPTGTLATTASQTTIPVRVRIGGAEARVTYSGAAPGIVGGGYQVNAVIPESVTPGSAVPVTIEAGSGLSQPGVTIAVQ